MNIIRKLPADAWYPIRDPKHFYAAIRSDVELLQKHRAYVSLATIIVCCLDAIAAGPKKATRGTFEGFVKHNFPDLVKEIECECPGKKGAAILYDGFRNGFAHLRTPKPTFAIAEEHELEGRWAGHLEIPGTVPLLALNVDRLAREFLIVLERLEADEKNGRP